MPRLCYCIVGQYCILKKGDCPVKFREGFIYWDDAAPWFGAEDTRQSSKGLCLLYVICCLIGHCCIAVMILNILIGCLVCFLKTIVNKSSHHFTAMS